MEQQTKVCRRCGIEHPIEDFRTTRHGTRCGVCNDCSNALRKATLEKHKAERIERARAEQSDEDARMLRLQDFTSRELMEELARRGYKGQLQITKNIDITNF